MDDILTLFSTGGLGAIVGTFGNWLNKIEERKNKIIDNDHQLKMAVFKAEQKSQQDDSNRETLKLEGQIQVDNTDAQSFQESLKNGAVNTGIMFVDAIRGLMRPLLTIVLLIFSFVLLSNIHELVNGLDSVPQEELTKLYGDSIQQLLFLTIMAVSWWFASRPVKK